MKAIETKYQGYRFRSRTEARWAVFFDTLNIEWEYELEGYDLDGTWYLPDFWLPELGIYAEIKGVSFNKLTETEQIKIRKLAYYSREPVVVLDGTPHDKDYIMFEYDPWSDELFELDKSLIDIFLQKGTGILAFIFNATLVNKIDKAIIAARSKRF